MSDNIERKRWTWFREWLQYNGRLQFNFTITLYLLMFLNPSDDSKLTVHILMCIFTVFIINYLLLCITIIILLMFPSIHHDFSDDVWARADQWSQSFIPSHMKQSTTLSTIQSFPNRWNQAKSYFSKAVSHHKEQKTF